MNPHEPHVFSIKRPQLEQYRHSAVKDLVVETYSSAAGVMQSRGALHRVSINRTAHDRYACRSDEGAFRKIERPAFTLGLQPAGSLLEVDGDGADYISIFQHPRVFRDAGWAGSVADLMGDGRLSAPADPLTLHLVLALAAVAQGRDAADPIMAEHLSICFARCVIRLLGLPFIPARDGAVLDAPRFKRIVDYIEAELARQDLSVEALAKIAHLSVAQFSRAFKGASGTAPHQFILARRIARARQLLERDSMSLSDIAYTTGFSSQAHFSTVFLRMTGATPKQFRRSHTM